nr:MAG TPA: hypothetical protein [Caudoviricetes sp.]
MAKSFLLKKTQNIIEYPMIKESVNGAQVFLISTTMEKVTSKDHYLKIYLTLKILN